MMNVNFANLFLNADGKPGASQPGSSAFGVSPTANMQMAFLRFFQEAAFAPVVFDGQAAMMPEAPGGNVQANMNGLSPADQKSLLDMKQMLSQMMPQLKADAKADVKKALASIDAFEKDFAIEKPEVKNADDMVIPDISMLIEGKAQFEKPLEELPEKLQQISENTLRIFEKIANKNENLQSKFAQLEQWKTLGVVSLKPLDAKPVEENKIQPLDIAPQSEQEIAPIIEAQVETSTSADIANDEIPAEKPMSPSAENQPELSEALLKATTEIPADNKPENKSDNIQNFNAPKQVASKPENLELKAVPQEKPLPPREQAIHHLERVLDSAPPEAKEALSEVIKKLKTFSESKNDANNVVATDDASPDIPDEKPFASIKSIQQLQVEASLGQLNDKIREKVSEKLSKLHETDDKKPALFPDNTNNKIDIPNSVSANTLTAHAIAPSSDNNIREVVSANRGIETPAPQTPAPPQEQVSDAIRFNLEAGRKEIVMQLKPHDLGEVRVAIQTNASGQVSARIMASTPEAHQSLNQNIDQLFKSLESHGIELGKITVVQASSGASHSSMSNDSRENNFSQQDSQNFQQNQSFQSSTQQQSHHQNQSFGTNAMNSDSFMDGGSSQAGDEASSTNTFDTDVEGEEVPTGAMEEVTQQNVSADGRVDIRA